jgi:hypothetical protein
MFKIPPVADEREKIPKASPIDQESRFGDKYTFWYAMFAPSASANVSDATM